MAATVMVCATGLGGVFLDQPGNSEIEQLRFAASRHQDVGRLQVAMDNQIAMRVGHRRQNLSEEPEFCTDVQGGRGGQQRTRLPRTPSPGTAGPR